jgi:hypothetical protein
MSKSLVDMVRRKFQLLTSSMTERSRRLWVGAEALAIGYGGVAAVAAATGMAISTVRKGRDEVRSGSPGGDLVRQRRRGGGRPRLEKKTPGLMEMLEFFVSPSTRGDPESPLRWTCKSTRVLAAQLKAAGHPVSPQKVGQLLRQLGYSLQSPVRILEGKDHPDRNAQFEWINSRVKHFIEQGVPVISVDAKKKELVGNHFNHGREWQPKGQAVEVLTYDFPDPKLRKAIPYGIYDIANNAALVNVGTDHDTPQFAVSSIEKWWRTMGSIRYPDARELFITADAGGSNGWRVRTWKAWLQAFADRAALTIHVSHFPPGTSKWNKIEHRLFSFITLNWRGRPLTSYETIVALIASTTTGAGLRVRAALDKEKYPLGQCVDDRTFRSLALQPGTFHGEWNYTFQPRSPEKLAGATTVSRPNVPVVQLSSPEAPARPSSFIPPATPTIDSHAARRARWAALIKDQLKSRLSPLAFCRERKIPYRGFMHARLKIHGRIRGPRRPRPKS